MYGKIATLSKSILNIYIVSNHNNKFYIVK